MVDRRARCIRFEDTKSGKRTRPVGRAALKWPGRITVEALAVGCKSSQDKRNRPVRIRSGARRPFVIGVARGRQFAADLANG
jgi:hypothetical protein